MSDENKSTETSWEEATRCPKCGHPGKDEGWKPGKRRGVKVHSIRCESTELCPWYNTTWLVQVNEDGTIPAPYSQLGPKQYQAISDESMSRLNDAIDRQLKAETSGEGEVRNPHSGR
jgi:hypothetical protein